MQPSHLDLPFDEQSKNIQMFSQIFTAMKGNPLIFSNDGMDYIVHALRVSHGINTQCITYTCTSTRTVILFNPDNNIIEAQEGGTTLTSEQISEILTTIQAHLED